MDRDRSEFFREATLRICSSLDVEKALFSCLSFVKDFVPASEMTLSLFDSGRGMLRNLAWVDLLGRKKVIPPTAMSRDLLLRIEASAPRSKKASIVDGERLDAIAGFMKPYADLSNRSILFLNLHVEGKLLGRVSLLAEGRERFRAAHAELVALLQEPFAIAMSNALRYEEVVRLKELVDAENRELGRELRYLTGDTIVGADLGLREVMRQVRQVAPHATPVMLLGETGVGKEVIANAVHEGSDRRNAPLVKVNCGAIPESLIDSELFGHERGAFTGAVAQKRGRFERADRGTIFLDEVGELPAHAQVRLLRVLQDGEFERVGGAKPMKVDVRVIAATHRDMAAMVETGRFREDLWFRLNVFPIAIPPLRERSADIPDLVRHFVERKAKELKLSAVPSVSAEGIGRLRAHDWPGNVRELENLVERELIHCAGKGGRLVFEHFDAPRRSDDAHPSLEPQRLATLDEAMALHITRALRRSGGKISGEGGAARVLGINPDTLRSRMRKLGLAPRSGGAAPARAARAARPRRSDLLATPEVPSEETPEGSPQDAPEVRRVIEVMHGQMTSREIQARLGLRDREHFRKAYLLPSLKAGRIEMTLPERRRSSKQRYRLPSPRPSGA